MLHSVKLDAYTYMQVGYEFEHARPFCKEFDVPACCHELLRVHTKLPFCMNSGG